MDIEKYLSTDVFKTREELVKETGCCDRVIRQSVSELKKKKPVIYNSQTKGYRLTKNLDAFNTVVDAKQEIKLIEHCINDIDGKIKDFSESKRTYTMHLSKLKEYLWILENANHIPHVY